MSVRIEQLLQSHVFVVLITKSYLNGVENKDKALTEQISIAKEFDKPTFLIYMSLSAVETKEADELFKEHRVIKTLTTTRKRFKQEADPFVKEMCHWCDRNLGD